MWDHFSCHINDEARTSWIWEALNTLISNYFDELDLSVLFGDNWKVHVDEVTEFVAGLIEVQDNEGSRIGFGDFSDILVSGNLDDLTVFLEHCFHFHFLHAFSHVLLGELVFEIWVKLVLT